MHLIPHPNARMPLTLVPLLLMALSLPPAWGSAAETGAVPGASGTRMPAGDPAETTATETAASQVDGPSDPQDGSLWEQSWEGAGDLWRRSRDSAGRWLEGGQQGAEGLWQDSKQKAGEAWDTTRRYLGPSPQTGFARLWAGVMPTLEETQCPRQMACGFPTPTQGPSLFNQPAA